MPYEVKKLPKSEVEITVTLSKEDIEKHMKKAADDLSKEVSIKGFRPGHVPAHVLEQYVGKEHILARARELAIQKSYVDAIMAEKLQVIIRPKITVESEEPFKYKAVTAVMPEVEIKGYESIKVKSEAVKVSDKDIEVVVQDFIKYATTYKTADRGAKEKDRIEIDFEGFDEEGKAVTNTKSVNHPVVIGDKTLIPGFEDELIGLKKGDKKEFDLTFPKDYGKEDFRNKKMKFKVEIKNLEEPIIPELSEELIEKMTGKKQKVEEFKKGIEIDIEAQKKLKEKQRKEGAYIEELVKKMKVEIPEILIEEEVEYIIHDMQHEIEDKGVNFEEFLKKSNLKMEDLMKKYRPEAERRIKVRLALQYVIKAEKIEISEEQTNAELDKIKAYYPPSEKEKIEKEFLEGSLRTQIVNRLALEKLFEKVLS